LIRNQRVFSTQERARRALAALRLSDTQGRDYATHDFTDADLNAHELSDAIADLVAMALHVEDDS
jgi:hypothetical protein